MENFSSSQVHFDFDFDLNFDFFPTPVEILKILETHTHKLRDPEIFSSFLFLNTAHTLEDVSSRNTFDFEW